MLIKQAITVSRDEVGNRYQWVVLLATFFASGATVIDRIAWASASNSYAKLVGLLPTERGSFFTAFYIGYFISNAISGFSADRIGGRRMIGLSLVTLGIATWSFGSTTSIATGLAMQVVMGLTAGMDYSACVRLLSIHFDSKRLTTAMGLFLASIPAGMVIANSMIPTLLLRLEWSGVYRLLGTATSLLGIVIYLILKDDSRPSRVREPSRRPKVALLRNVRFTVAAMAGFGILWGSWGFAFWSNALLIHHGFDAVKVGFVVSLFGGVGIFAKPLVGWIVDRIRIPKTISAATFSFAFAVVLFSFSRLHALESFAIGAGLVGFFGWGAGVIIATLVIDKAGREQSGAAAGIANAIWMIGNGAVSLVVGAVYQHTKTFDSAILTLAAGPAAAAVILALLARSDARVKSTGAGT